MDLPPGPFDLIYADPPLGFATWSARGDSRSPQRKYRCTTLAELAALPIAAIAAPNSILALWCYGPRLIDTLALIPAWGFVHVSNGFTWIKTTAAGKLHFGTGYYTRKGSETLLLAKRGQGLTRRDRGVPEVILAPRRRHSQKPAEAAERLERLFGDVRRIELFARERRPGWDAWGDEAGAFDQVIAPSISPDRRAVSGGELISSDLHRRSSAP